VTLELLNILVVKVLVYSVCALYKFYIYVYLITVICFLLFMLVSFSLSGLGFNA